MARITVDNIKKALNAWHVNKPEPHPEYPVLSSWYPVSKSGRIIAYFEDEKHAKSFRYQQVTAAFHELSNSTTKVSRPVPVEVTDDTPVSPVNAPEAAYLK